MNKRVMIVLIVLVIIISGGIILFGDKEGVTRITNNDSDALTVNGSLGNISDVIEPDPEPSPVPGPNPAPVPNPEPSVPEPVPIRPTCGNGQCEDGEAYEICAGDCPRIDPQCANGVCEGGESYESCPADCSLQDIIGTSCGDDA